MRIAVDAKGLSHHFRAPGGLAMSVRYRGQEVGVSHIKTKHCAHVGWHRISWCGMFEGTVPVAEIQDMGFGMFKVSTD